MTRKLNWLFLFILSLSLSLSLLCFVLTQTANLALDKKLPLAGNLIGQTVANVISMNWSRKRILAYFIRRRSSCGQSYKASTIANYNSRVVHDLKIPHITTLES